MTTPIASPGVSQAFTTQIQRAVADGKLSKDEYKELKAQVESMNVPESEKQAFLKLADKIKDFTNVGLFTSDGVLEKSEMAELTRLAGELKDSTLATQLFDQFSAFARPVEDTSLLGKIGNFFSALFSGSPAEMHEADARVTPGAYRPASFEPNGGIQMPDIPSQGAQGPGQVGVPTQVPGQTEAYTSQWGDVALAQAGQIPGNPAIHRRESQANCGVASASMILKQFGIQPPDMHAIRERIGARTSANGNEGGAFAISTQQLSQAVKLYAGDQGKGISSSTQTLPRNAGQALGIIADKLAQGEKVVLLTGGFGGTTGHYTVVKGVNPDGSFIVDDPARGPNMRVTAEQLQQAMQVRLGNGQESEIMSFKQS